MGHRTLLPDASELRLESVTGKSQTIILLVHAIRPQAACPACGHLSQRIHSSYTRKLADLPWNGIPVLVQMRARRFFCMAAQCEQSIFTERLPNTAVPHARRTVRLSQVVDWLTLALGGEAGAQLARQVGIVTSGDTLLRQLRQRRAAATAEPRVLGIDDWAWRKGHRYGTILCDLERGRVVDLLPDRSVRSVAEWLRKHPGIEIISRDRASAYAEAARIALPQVVQVADRWHLLHNLVEALQRVLESKHEVLAQTAKEAVCRDQSPAAHSSNPLPTFPPPPLDPSAQQMSQTKRSRRLARYESVMELVRQGVPYKKVARTVGINPRTVRRWVRAGSFPERAAVQRCKSLDSLADELEQRYREGCHNAAQLWRDLRQQGFAGSQCTVRRWLQRRYPKLNRAPQPRSKIIGSPRQTAWLLLQQPKEAKTYIDSLSHRCPEIAATAAVAREFFRMVRQRDAQAWTAWLQLARTTALARFANHLLQDEAAMIAALQLPWSNGPVEGHVHRLKLIKRQMYGRAKFDLLRLRVLHTA